jgi:hypothetical protein
MFRIPSLGLTFVLALLLTGIGCMNCHHGAYRECLRPVEQVGASAPIRAKVHTFLMNGVDVLDIGGLDQLRLAIIQSGYPKVYFAQRFDLEWYYREIIRLYQEDPEYRFVLVGQGAAAPSLQQLACRLTQDGVTIDAVVYLDPHGVTGPQEGEWGYPSYVISAKQWLNGPRIRAHHCNSFAQVSYELREHPAADAIISLLLASALQVPNREKPIDCLPLLDEKKPVPRPNQAKKVPAIPAEWDVLCPKN